MQRNTPDIIDRSLPLPAVGAAEEEEIARIVAERCGVFQDVSVKTVKTAFGVDSMTSATEHG
jgi:hypothetical protein